MGFWNFHIVFFFDFQTCEWKFLILWIFRFRIFLKYKNDFCKIFFAFLKILFLIFWLQKILVKKSFSISENVSLDKFINISILKNVFRFEFRNHTDFGKCFFRQIYKYFNFCLRGLFVCVLVFPTFLQNIRTFSPNTQI